MPASQEAAAVLDRAAAGRGLGAMTRTSAMKRKDRLAAGAAILVLVLAGGAIPAAAGSVAPADASATPQELHGSLFAQVELRGLFPDSKSFADAAPRLPAAQIMAEWRAAGPLDDAGLRRFVLARFRLPAAVAPAVASLDTPLSLHDHIVALWPQLTRQAVLPAPGGSALRLPYPYVVPGGRFRELYYWDSYFTLLGLKADGRDDLVEAMIDDFGALIDRYGHIPNGARTYYLSRSQPPLFYAMVALSTGTDAATQARRLRWMRAEHAYWMQGEAGLAPGEARAHVIALPDGSVLNRYFDAQDTPRDEAYREDVATARAAPDRPAAELYRDLRAGAESGWDYSSRWLQDGRTLAAIHTTDIAPADLNSLLYGLETAIASACRRSGRTACTADYDARARARAAAMQRHLWDEKAGLYRDYDWRRGVRTAQASAATLYPLFAGLAPAADSRRVAAYVSRALLAPGGLRTTPTRTGQQWDDPNGWAPLQWIAVQGLERYDERALASTIACRWKATVARGYAQTGKLLEKYDVETAGGHGGGGEYPLQDGFGWTNGVSEALAPVDCAGVDDGAHPKDSR